MVVMVVASRRRCSCLPAHTLVRPCCQVEFLRSAWDHAKLAPGEYAEVWSSVHRDFVFLPSRGRYERAASATNTERLEALKARGRAREAATGVACTSVGLVLLA